MKQFTSFLLVLIMLLSLFACADNSQTTAETKSPSGENTTSGEETTVAE